MATNLSGQKVGKYDVLELLGKGGMGEVYRCRHEMLGREVAIKVLSRALCDDEEVVLRFRQEAKAVNRIGHDCIVQVTDFDQLEDGRSYYVMELLKGRSLFMYLQQRGRLSLSETHSILAPVMEALSAAHAANIIHRDIKPDNIFLKDRGPGRYEPKLLDFGIAKLVDPGASGVSTRTGALLGTPLYMSPEQAAGDIKDVGTWSDVYSVAAVLFHMLTGRPPYQGESFGKLLIQHMQAPPPSLIGVVPDASPLADALIQKAMAKAPANRYHTMQQFLLAFNGVVKQSSPTAVDISPAAFRQTMPGTSAAPVVAPAPPPASVPASGPASVPASGPAPAPVSLPAAGTSAVSPSDAGTGAVSPVGATSVAGTGAGAVSPVGATSAAPAAAGTGAISPPASAAVPPASAAVPPASAAVPPGSVRESAVPSEAGTGAAGGATPAAEGWGAGRRAVGQSSISGSSGQYMTAAGDSVAEKRRGGSGKMIALLVGGVVLGVALAVGAFVLLRSPETKETDAKRRVEIKVATSDEVDGGAGTAIGAGLDGGTTAAEGPDGATTVARPGGEKSREARVGARGRKGKKPRAGDADRAMAAEFLQKAKKALTAKRCAGALNWAWKAEKVVKKQEHQFIIGKCACRVGNRTMARYAYQNLRGRAKRQVAAMCKAKRIYLGGTSGSSGGSSGGSSSGGSSSRGVLPDAPPGGVVMNRKTRMIHDARRCGKRHGVSGQTRFHVWVSGKTGKVTTIRFVGPFNNTPVGRCIKNAVKKIRFPKFKQRTFMLRMYIRIYGGASSAGGA